MIVLSGTCVWGGAVKELRLIGHDVVCAGQWPEDPGNEEILEIAENEGHILVTLNKDFGELVIVCNKRYCGIARLVNLAVEVYARIGKGKGG